MSISSTTRKAGLFAGTGAALDCPFTFKVFAATDLVVTKAHSGVETALALITDFTVTLNADQDNNPGGNVHLLATALGDSFEITSDVLALQGVVITNAGGFFPEVFNAVFDRLTILSQQLAEKVARSLTIPITSTGVTSLKVPVVPSGVLQWLPDGSGLQAITLPDLAAFLALPSTVGNSGQFLTNDGAGHFSWAAISGAVSTARLVSTSGLATGGGDLSADRTITVPKAAGTDINGYNDTKAVTGKALLDACAFGTLTDAATVAWNTTATDGTGGMNVRLTLTANGHSIGAPTNMKDGVTYTLNINPATFTLTGTNGGFDAIFDFGKNGAPTLVASKWNKVTGQYDATAGKLQCAVWSPA